jgi:hypothetical protein
MSEDGIRVRGSFRLNIVEDTPDGVVILGDSGWVPNTVTQYGFEEFITDLIAEDAGSLTVSHAGLGTGTAAINSTQSKLTSELTHSTSGRAAVTAATSNTSVKVRWVGTFASANSFVTAAVTVGEVGLFQVSTTNAATLAAGATFSTSQVSTNQNVNLTYDWDFS